MPKSNMPGGSKKKLRSARHQKSGKYQLQRLRTEANKAKRKARLFTFYDTIPVQSLISK